MLSDCRPTRAKVTLDPSKKSTNTWGPTPSGVLRLDEYAHLDTVTFHLCHNLFPKCTGNNITHYCIVGVAMI